MTPVEVIRALMKDGHSVRVQDGNLVVTPGDVAAELVAALREHKPKLVAMLSRGSGADPPEEEQFTRHAAVATAAPTPPETADDREAWPELRYPFAVRWARERGLLLLRDCTDGQWLEGGRQPVPATLAAMGHRRRQTGACTEGRLMPRSQQEATLTIEPAPDFGPDVRRVVVDCPHATTRVHIGGGALKMDDAMASALAVQTHYAEDGCSSTRKLRLMYLTRRMA